MDIHSLPPKDLVRFIQRIRKFEIDEHETYLHGLLVNILSEIVEFVPSEGSVILIDQPLEKHSSSKAQKELTYVAAFGPQTQSLIGRSVTSTSGIVGETYTLGKPAVRKADDQRSLTMDRNLYRHPLSTLISVPLRIENAVIGVLLLFNKKDPVGYTIRDLKLVEIFAGYLSTSIQNAIDAHKARELSKRDDLTGLFNDRFFHRQLETEVRKADEGKTPLCLAFMDLDNFKSINDQYGHLVGSQTLKEIGFVIREIVDVPDATLARYGGDEYVMIFPSISIEKAVEFANAIREEIKQKMFMIELGEKDGSFVNFKGLLSCSVGVASLHDHIPEGGSTKDRKNLLIRLADTAMYTSKDAGKNCVTVASSVAEV